jgi:hypothetical protein
VQALVGGPAMLLRAKILLALFFYCVGDGLLDLLLGVFFGQEFRVFTEFLLGNIQVPVKQLRPYHKFKLLKGHIG